MPKNINLEKKEVSLLFDLYNSGLFDKAESKATHLVKHHPKELILHIILGAIYATQGKLDQAIFSYKKALNINPHYAEAYNNIGNVLQQKKSFKDAEKNYEKAIRAKPDYAEAYYNYAILLTHNNKPEKAIEKYNKAILYNKNYFQAYYNIGILKLKQNNFLDAQKNFEKTININPDHYESYNSLGNLFKKQNNFKKAILFYNKSLSIKPDYYMAYNNLGNVLQEEEDFQNAISSYQKSVAINPNHGETHNNLGAVFHKLGKFKYALHHYNEAIRIKSDYSEAHNNLGMLFQENGYLDKAIINFKKAYKLNPNLGDAIINYWHLRQFCCDWEDQKLMKIHITKYLKNYDKKDDATPLKTFPLLSMFDEPKLHLKAANHYSRNKMATKNLFLKKNILKNKERIKIAYFSDDFKDHPSSYLTAGIFENHSIKKFEIYCISTSRDDKSKIRQRIKSACENFIDVSQKSNFNIIKLISEIAPNILIDINGHTKGSKLEIFSHFPKIPTVGFLGYAGTVGGNINQYKIADYTVIPKKDKIFFSEKIIYIPNTYHCTDDNVEVINKKLSKAECNLPKENFIFCCFNQSYKITPNIFNIWLNLLKKTKKSVLWLMATNRWAENNLKNIAEKKGINKKRIIFAKKLPHNRHLARIHNADLFLDTTPYNAHTTASDALWAGIPVLTIIGRSFAARVGASILNAISLPELITSSFKEYEKTAIKIANSPKKLNSLKEKIKKNKLDKPLFNTGLYTNNLEKAYEEIWKDYKK